MTYDLIIIGAGPAGMTAAIYAARYKLKVLVIGKIPGGYMGEAHEVCNFPTYEKATGMELVQKMVNQVKNLGVEIKTEEVLDVKKGKEFIVSAGKNEYSAKKILIATGSKRRSLGVEREKELTGKGLHYCATCDAGFYKDKIVGVAGGGDAALTAALLLSKFAKKVYLIYRRDKFINAEPTWVDEVKKVKNIEPLFNSEITELIGKDKLERVRLTPKGVPSVEEDVNTEGNEVVVDGLFVEIGSIPGSVIAEKLGVKMKDNYIMVSKNQETNAGGVFAAGDVTDNPLKQIVTACGEGAIAGYSVYKELMREKK
ncbi:FAD-dependent oxidoreductase [Candidatus Pacearchaeota archaeon]|nr:FAD-dependent oxidoreductase [Candidatus Pacearchaeota archaeon]